MPIKPPYYLLDHKHNASGIRRYRMVLVASQIVLKYGLPGNRFRNFKQSMVNEFWTFPDDRRIPAAGTFKQHTTNSRIKWMIGNAIKVEQSDIWNNHFLHGVATNGIMTFNTHTFPSIKFESEHFENLVKMSPFGGRFRHYQYKKWSTVPALCLSYSDKELSFMAGVLAGGEPYLSKDGTFAAYSGKRAIAYLKQWNIPIEQEYADKVLISPMWPALFIRHMPPALEKIWMNVKKPFRNNIYPVILWHTYIAKNWKRKGLPYLKSKRAIIYQYGGRGALDKIERLRVELNLVALDDRIGIIVKEWRDYDRSNTRRDP